MALRPAVDCPQISAETDGTGRLLIPNSKTDQTGQGAVVFLSKTTMDAVDAYRQLAGMDTGPLFRRIRRGNLTTESRISAHGARLAELQNAGRWQSPDMPGRYSRGQAAGLGAVARLRESTGD